MKPIIFTFVISFVILLSTLVFIPNVTTANNYNNISSQTVPISPKTPAQMATEAYAIEANARSLAGRKTNNATDGSGGSDTLRFIRQDSQADFSAGTFNFTTTSVYSGNDVLQLANGDDFSEGYHEPYWHFANQAGTGLSSYWAFDNGVIYDDFEYPGVQTGIMYTSLSGLSQTNVSIDFTGIRPGGVLLANGCNVQNITILDSAPAITPTWGHEKVGIFTLHGCGYSGSMYGALWYIDGSNITHWFYGGSWTTVYNFTTFYTGGEVWEKASIERDSTDYIITVTHGITTILTASIAISNVRNGTSSDVYSIGQQHTYLVGGFYDYAAGVYDNWTLNPGFSSGTYTSRPLGAGSWNALFNSAVLVNIGSGTLGMKMRFSNNSDMSNPSSYIWITSADEYNGSHNWRGGFFQLEIHINSTAVKLDFFVVYYLGKSYGDPPSKDIWGVVSHDSEWAYQDLNLLYNVTFKPAFGSSINIRVVHSFINLKNITFNLNGSAVVINNSTLTNSSFFFKGNTGINTVSYQNATLYNFGGSWYGVFKPVTIPYVVDTNVIDYNRNNDASAAFIDVTYLLRVYSSAIPGQNTGSVATHVRYAKYNVFSGGFLQLVWGSDGSAVVHASQTAPYIEWVNWSYNYANRSNHTVFGFYGSSFGHFALAWTGHIYGTIYNNYINNSRYITIQSSGNQTNLRIIKNYLQGVSASFTEAIGIFEQDHNYTISYNYIWNMNSINNRGIVITDFYYNITVSHNVIYDVGVWHIDIEGGGLKYKDNTSTEQSAYTWRTMQLVVSDNYLSGVHIHEAIRVTSGYTQFYNNTITGVDIGIKQFNLVDGWDDYCEASQTWVDWFGGYADISSVNWTIPNTYCTPSVHGPYPFYLGGHERDVWIRSFALSTISSYPANLSLIVKSSSSHWNLSFSPINKMSNSSACWLIKKWTTLSNFIACRATDQVHYNVTTGINTYIWLPIKWVNKTMDIVIQTSIKATSINAFAHSYSIRDLFDYHVVRITFHSNDSVEWLSDAGHYYRVSTQGFIPINSPLDPIATLGFAFYLLLFVTSAIIFILFALWVRKRRGLIG